MSYRPIILLLGAGASFGARASGFPDPNAPPLGDDLADYLVNWLDANDPEQAEGADWVLYEDPMNADVPGNEHWTGEHAAELRALLTKPIAGSVVGTPRFEARVARAMDDGSLQLLMALNHLTSVAMLGGEGCVFQAQVDRFDALLNRIHERTVVILTLNYDLLLEEALERRAVPYHYPRLWHETEAGLPLIKVHGSVNFLHVNGHASGSDLNVVRQRVHPTKLLPQEGIALSLQGPGISAARGRKNVLLHMKDGRNPPVLATYAKQKPSVFDKASLDEHRETGVSMIAAHPEAETLVIGVRPPTEDDDPVLCRLFDALGRLRGRKVYVSPSATELDTMRARGFEGFSGTFESFLSSFPL